VKVTVCQLDNRPQALPGAWARLVAHVRRAGSELVLLPEMCFGEWVAADPQVDAARWAEAVQAHAQWLPRLAELAPAHVISTRPVETPQGRRNRAYLHAPGEPVQDLHDKTYLPDEPGFWEASWYGRGPVDFPSFDAAGARCGVQICTELWFMRHARAYAGAGVQLLCVPRATPHDSLERWLVGGRTAAVIAPDADLGGLAWVADPEGQVLATTSRDVPFATVDIDPAQADRAKQTYPRYVRDDEPGR